MKKLKKKNYTPYKFLLPTVLTILVVIIVPFCYAIYMTFHDINLAEVGGGFKFIGLGNYRKMLTDDRMLSSLITTAKYVLGAVTLELLAGLFIALVINREFMGKRFVRSLILIPFFVTPVVAALMWSMFYEPTAGILNYILSLFSISPVNWLGSTSNAIISVILVDAWLTTPFMVMIILAALEGIPPTLYEAAYVDGAGELFIIRHISIPIIMPAVFTALTLRIIDALKTFDIIFILTQGGPGGATETLNLYSYTVGFNYFRLGYATTITFVFTIIISLLSGVLISRAIKD